MPAYFRRTVSQFLRTTPTEIIGELADGNTRYGFTEVGAEQIAAWREEIQILQEELSKLCHRIPDAAGWGLLLEFPIPRRQHRIDAVLLANDLIFVLEFKSGTSGATWSSGRQAEDYSLDLSYFHAPSRNRLILPIVVAPNLRAEPTNVDKELVRSLLRTAPENLAALIESRYRAEHRPTGMPIDPEAWDRGIYEPVPTIIEAAMALYSGMSVREIARSHAGEQNLTTTTEFLLNQIQRAQRDRKKIICFVTGIPGAGKTLVGLNLVHNREIHGDGRPASVFMSGNGPLVEILREALALDSARRLGTTKAEARFTVKTSVQNIHHFVRDNLERPASELPHEKAIVFDEAQRAWNTEQTTKKHKRRSSVWHVSEPEMILRVMDRHPDWAVIIALVGGGQEIHEGEAGLSEWGKALQSFANWEVLASPEALAGGETVGGKALFEDARVNNTIIEQKSLHLTECVRSHQATSLASWVNHVLIGNSGQAKALSQRFGRFPICITRDLARAKSWLREQARGERRCGLTASSGAIRLRAYGIETSMAIREAYSYPLWFLAPRDDVRSSYQLETVATEFEIQGLELDLSGLCWGGDFVWSRSRSTWEAFNFSGKSWKVVRNNRFIRIRNKYRVLLTRAREGLVIWVPEGDDSDPTRTKSTMNETAEYLLECGVHALGDG